VRFRIEQIFLTDEFGKVINGGVPQFHLIESGSVDDALRLFVSRDEAEIVGDVLKLPGFQAIATARRSNHVYTLQVSPVSDRFKHGEFRETDRENGR